MSYLDPAFYVLRNKVGATQPGQLDIIERRFVTQRIAEGAPSGEFDLAHLRAIHRHLFQDVFDWAGELRTEDIEEHGAHFQAPAKIANHITALHRDIAEKDFLHGSDPGDFAREAASLMGEMNYVHPFREGNSHALLIYLKQLAERAGHPLDLTRLPAEPWIEASEAALAGDLEPMASMLTFALS